jgi:hypothetical protein
MGFIELKAVLAIRHTIDWAVTSSIRRTSEK